MLKHAFLEVRPSQKLYFDKDSFLLVNAKNKSFLLLSVGYYRKFWVVT